jgi:hypothetical protein
MQAVETYRKQIFQVLIDVAVTVQKGGSARADSFVEELLNKGQE